MRPVITWTGVHTVPDPIADTLAASGWQHTPDDRGGVRVIWCGEDWDAGLHVLRESGGETARARTILVGDEAPPHIEAHIRQAGGLTWLDSACPHWVLSLIEDTLERCRREHPIHRLGAVSELEQHAHASTDTFLAAVCDHAARLLSARTWIMTRTQATFEPHDPERAGHAPQGLAEVAVQQGGVLVVPHVGRSRICRPVQDEPAAAVALPLATRTAIGEPDVVLMITWPRTFLPTPGEYRLLELLGVVARLNLSRLRERRRLVRSHKGHIDALAHMLPGSARLDAPDDAASKNRARQNVDRFVQQALSRHAGHPELHAIAVRLSASSRGRPPWHVLPAGHGWSPERWTDLASTLPRQTPQAEGDAWVVVVDVGQHGSLGTAIGSYGSLAAAHAAATGLHDLAAALCLGAHVGRWSADTTELMLLADQQTREIDPDLALSRMIGRIRDRMSADGARLHVVCRTSAGPSLRVLRAEPADAEVPHPEGLQDILKWCEWARVQQEDSPTQHLLVPVYAAQRAAGVLEVWRDNAPFDDRLDPNAMVRFAPHVAAACRRVLHIELIARRSREMGSLLQHLDARTPTARAASVVAERVGRLADAAATLILRREARHGTQTAVYVEAIWCEQDSLTEFVAYALRELSPVSQESSWTDAISSDVQSLLHAWGVESLVHRLTVSSPTPKASQPTSAMMIFDAVVSGERLPAMAPDTQDEAATELFHYAAALLENNTRSAARAASERLAKVPSDAHAISAEAAGILQEIVGADAVIVALGDRARMKVRYVWPERPSLLTLPLPHERAHVDPEFLGWLARTFGWERVRSAHLAPLNDGQRRLGALLVLTADTGPQLGWHRTQIIEAVARRMGFELHKAARHAMLADLNSLAGRLAGHHGAELGRRVVDEMDVWVQEHLRADGRVMLIARSHGQQTLVIAGATTDTAEQLRALNFASRRWGQVITRWDRSQIPEGFEALEPCGLAVPFLLPDSDKLTGHLVVLSASPFTDDHVPIAREAARELSVVLESERVRHGFMAEAGVFRHALLSPVQGLNDAAQFLAALAARDGVDPKLVEKQRTRIARESEKIRRWRTIQRLYGGGLLGGKVQIRALLQPLKPVIENCMGRFAAAMAERNVDLLLDWSIRGRDMFRFDEDAMDIILSNLLDNASKYVFYNRHVTVGAHDTPGRLLVWVSDVGHAVPDKDVYTAGTRLDWEDPFRTIHGDGLGLYISRSLAVAHGGELSHSCRPERQHTSPDQRDDTRPWVVRFTASFPQ